MRAGQWALTRVTPGRRSRSGLLGRLLELARPGQPPVPQWHRSGTAVALRTAGELTAGEMDTVLDAVRGVL
ncbi:hypothetical protein ACIQAD_35150 [Streptomyces sp. NPDC088551]|uniref:hypothetical protein n=1 Tax=Streptomyces sp. NPDC088551 TaxID=3365863 RepID=UPI0037FE3273